MDYDANEIELVSPITALQQDRESRFSALQSGEEDVIHLLGQVYRKQVRNAERLVTRRFGMRMTEFTILHMLSLTGPQRLHRISQERFLLSEDVFLAAGTLLERGYIRFAKTGGHFGPAEVTALGRRIVERLAPRILDRQSKLTQDFAKSNRTRLLKMLAQLEASLDGEARTQDASALELDQLADIMDGNDIAA